MDIKLNTPQAIESGDPENDLRAFRRCLSQFATGVTVMTACNGQELAGMSVNSFAALSLEPPLVLWSIRKESSSLDIFQKAKHYAVNILADTQVELSNLFSKGGEEKFNHVAWHKGKLGAPLLDNVICTLECSLENIVDGGDHFILIGRVRHYARYDGTPLLFYQGRYGVANDWTALMNKSTASNNQQDSASQSTPVSLLRRLHYVSHLISSRFNTQRQQLGISVAEFRIYGWLKLQAMSEQKLQACIYLSQQEIKDALQEMKGRNHIEGQLGSSKISLTNEGLEHARFIHQKVKNFETNLTNNIDKNDLETALRVIDSLISHTKNA